MKTGPLDPARIAAALKRAEPKPAQVKAPVAQAKPQVPAQADAFEAPRSSKVERSGHEQVGKRTTDWSFESNSNTTSNRSGSRGRDGGIWKAEGQANFQSDRDVAYDRETTYQVRPSTGQTGPRGGFVNNALNKGQEWGDKLAEMGLRAEFSGSQWDTRDLSVIHGGEGNSAGATYGTAGSSNFSIGTDGLKADFERAASAGAYANSNGEVEGAYGSAAYQASAKAEASASVDGNASVNLNGVDAAFNAQVGVKADASVSGQVESRPLATVGGVELTVAAEGTATVSAEAEAHANATAKITRDPPTAIIEAEAGASAVVKAEVEGSISAGPFELSGSAYASAGAEAVAGARIGYEDGKFTIDLNLGAAVGIGAGAQGALTVDVEMIGDMAYDIADANNDGQLGLDDAFIIGKNVVEGVGDAVENVGNAVETVKANVANVVENVRENVSNAVENVRENVSTAVETVRANVSNAVDNAKDRLADAGNAVKNKVSGAASWVRGKFGW